MSKYKQCRYKGKRMRYHVAIFLDGVGWDTLPFNHVVHHIDFNPRNNSIENLILLTKKEHDQLHASLRTRSKNGRFVKKHN